MDTAARAAIRRPELVSPSFSSIPQDSPTALTVTAIYRLSEAGRKASLLAGGDGRAVQHVEVRVPSNRLHLVTVTARGVARLKLRPRFELDASERVRRIDEPPVYDAPPSVEELFKEAARNHELERAYRAELTASRAKRREAELAWRGQIAGGFLADPTQRAGVHPSPSPKRCFLVTPRGRVAFDVKIDEGPGRDVPPEAYRRFRADLQATRAHRQQEVQQGLEIHTQKKQAIAAWIEEHGTPDQKARQTAGLLPVDEAVEAMTDEVFDALADRPRYVHDGVARLQAFLRQFPDYASAVVTPLDLAAPGRRAISASRAQWALLQEMQAAVPDARAELHVRELIWRRDLKAPRLKFFTIVMTQKLGPVLLRREYAAPDA